MKATELRAAMATATARAHTKVVKEGKNDGRTKVAPAR